MRVTHKMMYDSFVYNMNTSLSDLLDLNLMTQTQKKVNKPSDDPVGTTRILGHRDTLNAIEQYQENISTAQGWLELSDDTLTQVSNVLTRAREIAEQGSTGTLTAENREELSYEARQLFEQLLGLSNTKYDGNSLYAGQKTGESAFEEVLWMTTNDENVADQDFTISGSSDHTILIQFTSTGQVGTDALDYRYSLDGGDTFTNANLAAGSDTLMVNGVQLQLTNGTQVSATDLNNTNDSSGTWMWIRPTARYMGDDEDGIDVNAMGDETGLTATAQGNFDDNVVVRIDSGTTLDERIEYSYSEDGGITWASGNVVDADGTASNAVLSLPDGVLILSNAGGTVTVGSQYVVQPRTASIYVDISNSEQIKINDIGKEIFGGVYQDPTASNASAVFSGQSELLGNGSGAFKASNAASQNMFEAVGNLIGFLETNNQQGVQEALESLKRAQEQIMNRLASVGGRENRLEIATSTLDSLKLNEDERLSTLEDADVGDLMTELAQKQLIYEAVLQSSSLIMGMTLLDYV